MMLQAIKNDIENRFGGFDESAKYRVMLHIAYTKDAEETELWKQEVMEAFPGFRLKMAPLSLSVACHIGPGALAACLHPESYCRVEYSGICRRL